MKTFQEKFTEAYISALLWSAVDEDTGNGLEGHTVSADAMREINCDCTRFLVLVGEVLEFVIAQGRVGISPIYSYEQAGHDFALTRNAHATGFWDRDLGTAGEFLTNMAVTFPTTNAYLDDYGVVNLEGLCSW